MRYSWATNPFAPRSRLPAAKSTTKHLVRSVREWRSFVRSFLFSFNPIFHLYYYYLAKERALHTKQAAK